jgi:membrane protein
VLSVHRLSAELIAFCAFLTLTATLTGTLAGWVVLAVGGRRRPGAAARPRHGIALLTYALVLTMTWSFSTASTSLIVDVLQAQALRNQAQAQRSLPPATALSIWSVSEPTLGAKTPQIASFISQAQKEGSLVLAWAIPNGSTGDGDGPPTLYLNNTAAAHYGLPKVTEQQVTLYRPRSLAGQDEALTQELVEQARFNTVHGASVNAVTVTSHDLEEVSSLLPESLPAVSFFLSSEGIRTSDCLIAVVPDGYFAPDDYLSAITQGAAVLTGQNLVSLQERLREHHVEDLVARFDAVGTGNTALREQTMHTAVLHALVLLTTATSTAASAGLAARAWAQARSRRREIERLLGHRMLTARLLTAVLITIPVLILAWPLLVQPSSELVLTQAACALVLTAAAVVGTRHATPRPTHPRRRRQARHG